MLGFDVSVYYFDSHGKQQNIARWPANNLHWINDLVRQNRAALVLDGGGYPYAYEVLADEILSMFTVPERERLDRRIARKAGSGDANATGRDNQRRGACPLPRKRHTHGRSVGPVIGSLRTLLFGIVALSLGGVGAGSLPVS